MRPLVDLLELLNEPKRIVVVHHYNPDADAMGSSLALSMFLKKKGHTCQVISPNTTPDFLLWMPESEQVLLYDTDKKEADEILSHAEVLFCLDFNHLSRTRIMEETLNQFQGVRVMIDHHLMPDESFHFGRSDASKSSTCEMVYDFINEAGGNSSIDIPIAQCLYAGAMTDTGSFKFPSTTASVHMMAADLMNKGLQPSSVHQAIFDTYQENRLRFLGFTLSEKMKLYPFQHSSLIAINRSEIKRFEINSGDTEGVVNYPLSIGNIILSIFITERDQEIRMSFRSKGDFDVNEFARKYFNGGGHKNAAGGRSTASLSETIQLIEHAIFENKNQLIRCYNELPF